ncbi:MAG: hypothetical protein ACRC4L_03500 [Mycoplasma sp.]
MKKTNLNKYTKYFIYQSIWLLIAIAMLVLSIVYYCLKYSDSLNSTDPSIFWMGFLLIILMIITISMIIIILSLMAKSFFYMRMGYEYESELFIKTKEEELKC